MNAKSIEQKSWNESLWIKDESSDSSIMERQREIFLPNDILEKVVEKILTKELSSKIYRLEKQVEELKSDEYEVTVSNSAASELLKNAIKYFKQKGINEIDIIDLHAKTKLPFQQIGELMDELEKEGVVSEYGKNQKGRSTN